ncbi:Uncharacterized protein FWK35_00013357 [Aphis craccivora]|uniref:Uncharacterized protein n=1 Tax=Aphis craccivora TaxID=307492 RepID=A0A6G0ZBX5_APHCR|nr:Uncharacterized protein FWK35_00013357 [Aphis craccivora]
MGGWVMKINPVVGRTDEIAGIIEICIPKRTRARARATTIPADYNDIILYYALTEITPGNARATRRRLRPHHGCYESGSDGFGGGGGGVGGLDRTGGPGMMSAR